jgi:asparagine synthetase B (glutamine-hydrolysing)
MKDIIPNYETYLYLSYLPRLSEIDLKWFNLDSGDKFGEGVDDESWWVGEGVKALKKTMADEVSSTDANAIHIVPLSGGLDSRVVLGGLLENLPRSQITTATYGIPGAWDFEIAKKIARKYGVRHETFNLLDEKWDVEHLLAAATHLKKPVSVHQSYVRQKITNYFGKECVYWSGWMGDALAGVELPKIPNTDKRKALYWYINIEPTPNYKDQAFREALVDRMLLECPWDRFEQSKLTLDQQLFAGDWQRQLTQNIVIVDGYTFKTPFLNRTWMNFMANVPYKWLLEKHLYKEIIKKSYKELSKFGTTEESAGMSLFHSSKYEIILGKVISRMKPYIVSGDPYRSHPRTNYINWTESLRHKGGLQDSVYTTLQDLKKRAILNKNDIDTWWSDHLKGKIDFARLLMNLSSLELLLKAEVMM